MRQEKRRRRQSDLNIRINGAWSTIVQSGGRVCWHDDQLLQYGNGSVESMATKKGRTCIYMCSWRMWESRSSGERSQRIRILPWCG